MNERIKELVKAAEYWANTFEDKSKYQEHLMETFAGLIVHECVSILETEIAVGANTTVFNQDEWNKNNLHFTLLTNMVTLTKEHFGVE